MRAAFRIEGGPCFVCIVYITAIKKAGKIPACVNHVAGGVSGEGPGGVVGVGGVVGPGTGVGVGGLGSMTSPVL